MLTSAAYLPHSASITQKRTMHVTFFSRTRECALRRKIPKGHLVGNGPRGSRGALIDRGPVKPDFSTIPEKSIRNEPRSASWSLSKTINDRPLWMDVKQKCFCGRHGWAGSQVNYWTLTTKPALGVETRSSFLKRNVIGKALLLSISHKWILKVIESRKQKKSEKKNQRPSTS